MVKKEIKSAFSFVKQTVKFVFFLAHLLFQTKGNLKNPLKKVYSGKVAMLANGPSMKNVLPRLTTDEFKNTDFIVWIFLLRLDQSIFVWLILCSFKKITIMIGL